MYGPRGMGFYGRRGMGDAVCPSLEQLQGVFDSSDPCQASAVVTSGGGGGGSSPAAGCPVGSSCTFFSGVPNTAVYALGGILVAFMLLGGRR